MLIFREAPGLRGSTSGKVKGLSRTPIPTTNRLQEERYKNNGQRIEEYKDTGNRIEDTGI